MRLGFAAFGGSASLVAKLESSYNFEHSTAEKVEEEVTVSVAARQRSELQLVWKIIWQHGVAQALEGSDVVEEQPFQVAVSLTFDQKLTDGPKRILT